MKKLIYVLLAIPLLVSTGYAQEAGFEEDQPRYSGVNSLKNRIYKWTDDGGNIHYTQYKPTHFKAVEVEAPPPPPSSSPDLNASAAGQIKAATTSSNEKKEAQGRVAAKQKTSGKNAENCKKAQGNLEKLQSQDLISYINSEGERVRMPESERASKIAESKKNIDFFCK